ncbi:MAG: hypothetical protein AAGA53_04105 [Pseudomonadota bacterium]
MKLSQWNRNTEWLVRRLWSAVMLFFAFSFWLVLTVTASADIDNTARALGVFNGNIINSNDSSQAVPVIPGNPQIAVSKTGVLNDDDGTPGLTAGDTISYTIEVTNPGNISLDNISVFDPFITLTFQNGDTDLDNELDPGEIWLYTGSYIVTAFDLATNGGGDGDIDNTVTANSDQAGPVSDTEETLIDPNVAMSVIKTSTLNDDDGTPGLSAGDTVDYQISVQNIGVTDLTNVSIVDTLDQSGTTTPLVPVFSSGDVNTDNAINAGETWIYTVSYTLTQANLDDGGDLVNTASVTTDQIGPRDGVDTLPLTGFVDSYTMTKSANLVDGDGDNLGDAGEVINYTFRFTNTGNRTLANLLVNDPLPGLSAIVCANDLDADGDIDSLSPGQVLDCTASYTIQASDVVNGFVTNTATTSATRLNGLVPVAEDDSANDNSTTTPTDGNFELDVDKVVSSAVEILPNVVEIEYLISVTNLNAVTHGNVSVQDDVSAAISAPAQLIGPVAIVSTTGFTGTGTTNASFDGSTDIEIFSGDVQLAPLATGEIRLRAQVDRRSQSLDSFNTAIATTNLIPGGVPSDDPGETPGDPNDINPTPFGSPDTDGDGSPDGNESPIGDRDGDGIADAQDYDPTGYFYCEADGRILNSGLIAVENLTGGGIQTGVGSSNNITILQDGSAGFYQFYVTAPGTYRLLLTLPPSGVASTTRLSSGSLDVTSLLPANPGVLGAGEVGATGILSDFTAGANPFFTEFVIENGDPTVFNNNIPLALCGTPSVAAAKDVASPPVLQPDLTNNLTYRVTAENNGTDRVDNVSLADDLDAVFGAGNFTVTNTTIESAPAGFGATIDPFFNGAGNNALLTTGGDLEPGETVSVLIELNVDVVPANYTNTVVVGGENPLTGVPLTEDTASVTLTISGASAIDGVVATKTTPVDSAPLGASIPYTLTFENTGTFPVVGADLVDLPPFGFRYVAGTALVNGVAVEPELRGSELVWPSQDIGVGGTTTITLQLLLGAGVTGTEFTNTSFARNPADGSLLSNRARATIRLEIESVFQCSHIIGRVFDDQDYDGYHDTGEPGLAGVRLATVNGLLITTDQFGRYHVACDAIPDDRIGSNYILKLDERTLPSGYSVTSENPRVIRVTRGKLSKMNFAAANLRKITLALEEASFKTGGTSLTPESIRDIAKILPLLEEQRSVLELYYSGRKPDDKALKRERLEAVESLIEKAWKSRQRPHKIVIEIVEKR